MGTWKFIRGEQLHAYEPGPTTPNGTYLGGNRLDCHPGCLFDLEDDEGEHTNLEHKYPHLFRRMLERFRELGDTYYQTPGHVKKSHHAKHVAKEVYGNFWGPWKHLEVEEANLEAALPR